jgi:hypothetical protein
MKEKLRITSKLQNTEFVAQTIINGTWYVLTEDFIMMTSAEFETNPQYRNMDILRVKFTPLNKTWEFEYDTEDKPLPPRPKFDENNPDTYEEMNQYEQLREMNEMNRRKRIAVREFFSRHMQLEHGTDFQNGHAPSTEPIGIVEIVTQRSRLMHLADRKKTHVFTIVDGMTWQEQYDLALYYAPELAGKRRSEILHGLIGLKGIGTRESHLGGKLWQKAYNGVMTYADDFLANYSNNPTVVMKIYVNKAIALGIIVKNTNGLYLQGNTFVGRDSDDAVIYFSKDIDSYVNVVQPEVNRMSNLPEDDLRDEKLEAYTKSKFATKKQNQESTASFNEHYKLLKRDYKELTGKEAPNNIKYEEIKEIIEALKNEVSLGKSQTKELQDSVNIIDTQDLEKLKEYAKELGVPGYQAYKSVSALKEKIKTVLEVE